MLSQNAYGKTKFCGVKKKKKKKKNTKEKFTENCHAYEL